MNIYQLIGLFFCGVAVIAVFTLGARMIFFNPLTRAYRKAEREHYDS